MCVCCSRATQTCGHCHPLPDVDLGLLCGCLSHCVVTKCSWNVEPGAVDVAKRSGADELHCPGPTLVTQAIRAGGQARRPGCLLFWKRN